MKPTAAAFAALILVLAVKAGQAADRPPPRLHQQWLTATLACRGGAVSQSASEHGCERQGRRA